MSAQAVQRRLIYLLCFGVFLGNVALWLHTHTWQASWTNVPPVPSREAAAAMTLGDSQMAYRVNGLILQNIGSSGGRAVALKDYNFNTLGEWFRLEDELDGRSAFIPFLAAYYFSAAQDPSVIGPVINYLAKIGQRPGDGRWRWMAQAVFLARYTQKDLSKALDLSYKLAAMYEPGLPTWLRHMPALVLSGQGEKEAAYNLLFNLLRDEGEKMDPYEVRFIHDYICEQILTKEQAAQNPLCQPTP